MDASVEIFVLTKYYIQYWETRRGYVPLPSLTPEQRGDGEGARAGR